MLSERDIELAHPEAFDYVFGNLAPARRAEFDRHRADCRYCQGVIAEYGDIGGIIKLLPPQAEPPADLEDRTVAAMIAAVGEQPAEPETLIKPRPADPPTVPNPPAVTRLPVWRRYPGRLAAAVAIAAAIIAAAVLVPLRGSPAQTTVVIALRVTAAGQAKGFGAATGQAIARQDASGSWDITLTVQHLKHFDPKPWYECWYVSQDGRQAASAGTFLVPVSGSRTFTMTSAADPRDFRTMEITLQSPSNDGALGSLVILQGQSPVGA